jgi:4-hydroxybenzoate polyprenyltransferase
MLIIVGRSMLLNSLNSENESIKLILFIVCYLNEIITLVSLCLFFFFAGFYSATPIRAKARPVLDSIFSAGHYVATGAFGYLFVAGITNSTISMQALFAGVTAGMCWAVAMHAYSAVPDIEADRGAHLETIATKLEKRNTIILCALLYAISGILMFSYFGIISILLALVYVVFMFLSLRTNEKQLFKLYTYFPYINSIVGMIIFLLVALGQ